MILFMDWETTDIYLKGKPSEDPGQPHVCSVSAVLDDDDGNMVASMYTLIQVPPGTQWAPKAFEANGLSAERCNKYGAPLLPVMDQLAGWASLAHSFCAFSAYFDLKFAKISAAKIGGPMGAAMRERFESLKRMCTMETSARHLKGEGQRFIKLVEAHKAIMGRDFDGKHNALFDNLAQRAIYYRLKEFGVTDFGDTKVLRQGYGKGTITKAAEASTQFEEAQAVPLPSARRRPSSLAG